MTLNRTLDILLNIAFPLLLGILVYWLVSFIHLPAVIRNYGPDACWAYAFISAMLIIWDRKIKSVWVIVVFLAAAGYEVLQYVHVLPGTGDVRDVVIYFVAFSLALLSNSFFKTPYKFSTPKYE